MKDRAYEHYEREVEFRQSTIAKLGQFLKGLSMEEQSYLIDYEYLQYPLEIRLVELDDLYQQIEEEYEYPEFNREDFIDFD